jgi:hypothetical protein
MLGRRTVTGNCLLAEEGWPVPSGTACEIRKVGLAGFEPTTSWPPAKRANQAALQPVPNNLAEPSLTRSNHR